MVLNTRGECGPGQALSGYYFREARFLSACRLEIDGRHPWLCEVTAVDPEILEFSYVFPEIAQYGGGGSGQAGDDEPRDERGLPQRGLNIQLRYRVRVASLEISASILNSSRETLDCDIGWYVDADFADIQEAQGAKRQQQADVQVHSDGRVLTSNTATTACYIAPGSPSRRTWHGRSGIGWCPRVCDSLPTNSGT